jgi:hypothetical protein
MSIKISKRHLIGVMNSQCVELSNVIEDFAGGREIESFDDFNRKELIDIILNFGHGPEEYIELDALKDNDTLESLYDTFGNEMFLKLDVALRDFKLFAFGKTEKVVDQAFEFMLERHCRKEETTLTRLLTIDFVKDTSHLLKRIDTNGIIGTTYEDEVNNDRVIRPEVRAILDRIILDEEYKAA